MYKKRNRSTWKFANYAVDSAWQFETSIRHAINTEVSRVRGPRPEICERATNARELASSHCARVFSCSFIRSTLSGVRSVCKQSKCASRGVDERTARRVFHRGCRPSRGQRPWKGNPRLRYPSPGGQARQIKIRVLRSHGFHFRIFFSCIQRVRI